LEEIHRISFPIQSKKDLISVTNLMGYSSHQFNQIILSHLQSQSITLEFFWKPFQLSFTNILHFFHDLIKVWRDYFELFEREDFALKLSD